MSRVFATEYSLKVGLTSHPVDMVKSPLIVEAQASIECKFVQEMHLNTGDNLRTIIFGKGLLAHVKDELWVNGEIDQARMRLLGRVGDKVYCRIGDIFRLGVAGAARVKPKLPLV